MSKSFIWQSPLTSIANADTPPADTLKNVGLCDLSSLPRGGAKGDIKENTLAINGVMDSNNGLYCRLGKDELLTLASIKGVLPNIKEIMPQPRLMLPRQDSHCQIGLCGSQATHILARVCALAAPPQHQLLQTRIADISAIIISVAPTDIFYILADSGYALHLWERLLEAATHAGGGIVNFDQWQKQYSSDNKKD